MARYLLAAVITIYLSGCATQQKYGNFVTNQQDITAVLVADTTRQLESLYPPASTRFSLGQQIHANDMFGMALVDILRNDGYAIELYQAKGSTANGMTFNYVIDTPIKGDTGLYRIKLVAGHDTLSRAYIADRAGVLVPTGAWARMEGNQ